jgi:CBS domain-containing protein
MAYAASRSKAQHLYGTTAMNVSDIMTREVVSIAPECSVEEAVGLMLDKHLSGLPVIDRQG